LSKITFCSFLFSEKPILYSQSLENKEEILCELCASVVNENFGLIAQCKGGVPEEHRLLTAPKAVVFTRTFSRFIRSSTAGRRYAAAPEQEHG
jgi:hypothetical protein